MKKRALAMLLALCLVLTLGAGALAAEEGDGKLLFATEDGQTEFTSETPATVTMSVTVPEDGTYLITTWIQGTEELSFTSENEALAALIDDGWFDLLFSEPVELTAGEYAVTAENVTSMSVSLFHPDTSGVPDDIPPAAEWVWVPFRVSDGDGSSYFMAGEPTSATLTATVEQDGLYLLDAFISGSQSLSLTTDDDALAILSQFSVEDVGGEYGFHKIALVELTAGEYSFQIENATYCSTDLELTHPLEALDGVIGEGIYVCQVDEPVSVNYTVMGVGAEAHFYAGSADSLYEAGSAWAADENSDQAVVGFVPGMAVIDFDSGYVTSALIGSTDVDTAALEPIELHANNMDFANLTAQGTASVQASGYYLLAADIEPVHVSDPVSFAGDLPIQMDSDTVPDWTYSENEATYKLRAVVDLAIGDYAFNGNNIASSDIGMLIPGQTVDSLEGEFAQGGVYMCELSEPVTVTFTADGGSEGVNFYGGSVGELLQTLTPAADGGTLTVEFPAGIAVIDASNYPGSITGAVN